MKDCIMKKAKEIKQGDLFIYNEEKNVALEDFCCNSIFVTNKEFYIENGMIETGACYGYTNSCMLNISPEEEVCFFKNLNNEIFKNRKMYKWNPVFNFFMKIKDLAIEKEIDILDENIDIKEIVNQIGSEDDKNIVSILQINRYKNMILVRYGKYSDILSGESEITMDNMWDMYDGFYRECRSLVIDLKNESIVLCPFKKFRNLNEGEENSLENVKNRINNCESFEVSNKLDGSMQCATYYDDEIIMSGSQALDKEQSWRLQDGYNMLMKNIRYYIMLKENRGYTFIFEYISEKDAHVVKYSKEQEDLYLIGIRNNFNGEQMPYHFVLDVAKKYDIKSTELFNKNLEDILQDIKKYKSNEMEGFVLNIDGFMVKVKCDDYVQIHKTISSLSSVNGVIKAVADDVFDDFIPKIPTAYIEGVLDKHMIITNYVCIMVKYVERETKRCKLLFDNRKDFMTYVSKNYRKDIKGYIINRYNGVGNNFLKSGNEKSPHYKKMNEIKEMYEYVKKEYYSNENEENWCRSCNDHFKEYNYENK